MHLDDSISYIQLLVGIRGQSVIDTTEGCVDVSVHLPTSFSVSFYLDQIQFARLFVLIKPTTNSTVSIHAKAYWTKAMKSPVQ